MPRKRTDDGTFQETVSLDAVLGVFDQVRGPVITSSDVAEQLDCTTEAARQKLTRLYDQGKVDKRKTGRTTVWWLTSTPSPQQGRERRETAENPPADRPSGSPQEDTESDETGIRAAVEALDLQGSGSTLKAREDALVTVVEYLREEGSAPAGELKDLVDGDAVGYKDADSFWTNMRTQSVFEGLPVETPGRGGRRYTYTGDGGDGESEIYDPTEEF